MKRYNQRILKAIGNICERDVNVTDVDLEYYQNFLNIPESVMEALIRIIICDRIKDINQNILNNKWKTDEEIHEFIIFFLEMIFLGHIGIRERDMKLVFSKAVGDFPDADTEKRIDDKLKNSIPIIDKVILSMLPDQYTDGVKF